MEKKDLKHLLDNEDEEFKCFTCDPKLGKYQSFLKETIKIINYFESKTTKTSDESEESDPAINHRKRLYDHLTTCPDELKDSEIYKKVLKILE